MVPVRRRRRDPAGERSLSGSHTHSSPYRGTEKQTLEPNAIGFLGGLVIGLASTAPAYSLAAVIGSLVVVVGVQAPAALLASFVPMFLIAGAFFYMNRADPDAGTTFSWVTRALGPWLGWIAGWAVCLDRDPRGRLARRRRRALHVPAVRLGQRGRLEGRSDRRSPSRSSSS